jgi:hypothetical protein
VAQSLQTIFSACGAGGLPLIPGATVLNAPNLEAVCQWLKLNKTDTRTLATDTPHLRKLLKSTIWNQLVSNSEQHHALSNVLGPVILSGKPEPETPELDYVTLLRRLLSSCELVSWEDKNLQHKKALPSETRKDLQILLLDDQAKQGWEDWIKECLHDAPGTLHVSVDPTALVDAISDALSPVKDAGGVITGYQKRDARFCLPLPGLQDASHPVLLLDLRLFSGNAEAEREFLKTKLLPLVNHFTDKPDLAWPGFCSKDPASLFSRAKDAVEGKNGKKLIADTQEHHEVLTWLPRVVALADMSLPIILFSSTGRRDLVEPFKPYGNIITSFEKPRLHDLAVTSKGHTITDIHGATRATLYDAVACAYNWLRFRKAGRTALNACEATLLNAPIINDKEIKHFEIYFDESGSSRKNGFRVAALVVGYVDQAHAEVVAKEMHDQGISWFHDTHKDGAFIYDKEKSRDPQWVAEQRDHFVSHLKMLWVLPIVLWANSNDDRTAFDTFNPDTLIQSLVGELLEMTLFSLITKGASIAVYGAQRRIEIPGSKWTATGARIPRDQQTFSACKDVIDSFGIVPTDGARQAIEGYAHRWALDDSAIDYEVTPLAEDATIDIFTKASCRALFLSVRSPQDYQGILARAFQTRPFEEPWKTLASNVRTKLSPLNHEERAKLAHGDRPVHIVADILPGEATWSQHGASLNALEDWFPACPGPVLVAEGAEFSRLLSISRALDGKDYGLAVANAASLTHEFHTHANYLYQKVFTLLSGRLSDLRGNDLNNAAHHLAALPKSENGKLPVSKINIRHQHWTRYPIANSDERKRLEVEAAKLVLVSFNVKPKQLYKTIAEWVLKNALEDAYPSQGFDSTTASWWQDLSSRALFAVIRTQSQMPADSRLPHRKRSFKLPPSLMTIEPDLDADTSIFVSMGPPSIGRMILTERLCWFDALEVNLSECPWSESQIDAVIEKDIIRSLPLEREKAIILARALNQQSAPPRWFKEDGKWVLFATNNVNLPTPSTIFPKFRLVKCRPDDFSSKGDFLHVRQNWDLNNADTGSPTHVSKTKTSVGVARQAEDLPHSTPLTTEQRRSTSSAVGSAGAWLVRNFVDDRSGKPSAKDKYCEAGIAWHNLPEFFVQEDGIRIRVYARMLKEMDKTLLEGFVRLPDSPRDDQGKLPGKPWSPSGA